MEKGNSLELELQKLEEIDKKNEFLFRTLFNSASDAIFTIDLYGNFTAMNSTGERISGYSRQELLGMNMQQIVAAESLPPVQKNIQERMAGGSPRSKTSRNAASSSRSATATTHS